MLTKVDLRDFFEINQGLYGELPVSARQVAMMRVLVEAFSLAPADATRVSGGPVAQSAERNAEPAGPRVTIVAVAYHFMLPALIGEPIRS